jgi:predicted  nucleic acid-binding Zn-ribbon protein
MNEVFEKLRNLQDVLHTKFQIENEINDIPKILETKTEVLNRAKKTFIEKNERSEKLKEKDSQTPNPDGRCDSCSGRIRKADGPD